MRRPGHRARSTRNRRGSMAERFSRGERVPDALQRLRFVSAPERLRNASRSTSRRYCSASAPGACVSRELVQISSILKIDNRAARLIGHRFRVEPFDQRVFQRKGEELVSGWRIMPVVEPLDIGGGRNPELREVRHVCIQRIDCRCTAICFTNLSRCSRIKCG